MISEYAIAIGLGAIIAILPLESLKADLLAVLACFVAIHIGSHLIGGTRND